VTGRWRRTKHKVRRAQAALRLLGDAPLARVLDAPCGAGLLAGELARRGHGVWACDLDAGAYSPRPGVQFDVVDLEQPLPYPDGFFDAVVSLEGIEHLETPAVCLREFARVLRPGGALILSTPNVDNVQARWEYFASGRFSGFKTLARRGMALPPGPVHWHVTVPYLPTIIYLLTRAGLVVDGVEVTMIKTRQWLLLPVALPMWLGGRLQPAHSPGRLLGSWRLLLGRSVILRALKPVSEGGGG
jgi:SAM-dependent methyltransferase